MPNPRSFGQVVDIKIKKKGIGVPVQLWTKIKSKYTSHEMSVLYCFWFHGLTKPGTPGEVFLALALTFLRNEIYGR